MNECVVDLIYVARRVAREMRNEFLKRGAMRQVVLPRV